MAHDIYGYDKNLKMMVDARNPAIRNPCEDSFCSGGASIEKIFLPCSPAGQSLGDEYEI